MSTSPTTPASFSGIASGYIPSEYPKAVYNTEGKSCLARDPNHLDQLIVLGFGEEYVAEPAPQPADETASPANPLGDDLAAAQSTIKQLMKELEAEALKSAQLTADYAASAAEVESLKIQLETLKASSSDETEPGTDADPGTTADIVDVTPPTPVPAAKRGRPASPFVKK